MTPYYQDDAVTIYHGDCREWMPEADAVISDPPYGIAYSPRGGGRGFAGVPGSIPKSFLGETIVGDDQPFDPSHLLGYRVVVLFGANHYANLLPRSSEWIVWDKRDWMPSNDFADCELIWTNATGPARIFRHHWNGLMRASERAEKRLHPTQKPLVLMSWLIGRYTGSEHTILDPYSGSGTTLVAAKAHGRKAIGIEIEERYCEIAANRCRQEVLGLVG